MKRFIDTEPAVVAGAALVAISVLLLGPASLVAVISFVGCASMTPRPIPITTVASELIYVDGHVPVRRVCFKGDLLYLAGYDSGMSVFAIHDGCAK